MDNTYDFGLIGLGVMGRNFILNVADNGYSAFGHDLDAEKVNALKNEGGKEHKIDASTNIKTFVKALKQPRKIMLLVPAGKIVDSVIESLLPHIDRGDIIIDGGNSFFTDTDRREEKPAGKGNQFFRCRGFRRGQGCTIGSEHHAWRFQICLFPHPTDF